MNGATNATGGQNGLPYLTTLNDAQRTGQSQPQLTLHTRQLTFSSVAVTFPKDVPLQILAGPGSGEHSIMILLPRPDGPAAGKTRVLTARVAYLIHYYGLEPWEIVAVTFTNKAAQEMRKRLDVLLQRGIASRLILGTFHKLCVDYLRKYSQLINLPNNFSITDADDSKKIIGAALKKIQPDLKARHIALKDAQVQSEISKAKARNEDPAGMLRRAKAMGSKGEVLLVIAEVSNRVLHKALSVADTLLGQLYEQYETALRNSDCLDFDDLLLYGVKLFTKAPGILSKVRHILVDEFQVRPGF